MARSDLRFDRSPVTLEHHSARGRVLRNASEFTRGSQLIGHQFFMFMAGARVPLLIWLACFIAVYWIMLYSVMGEHEIQLCAWRIWSAISGWMEFDAMKPMNIVLSDDALRQVPIGYIPLVPDVQVAWAKAVRALFGALCAATLFALPVIWWFITLAQGRGSSILEERHERGAMLVSRDILLADVMAHNEREFVTSAAQLFPGKTAPQVIALPLTERIKAGLHHPYSLAGIPYPYGLEASHTILVGTTGAGKTTQLRNVVAEVRARGGCAVIFDLTGAFIEAFYDERTDIILNPGDARCPSWSLFDECSTQAEFTAAAQALVPHDGGGSDPFWVLAARMLFVQMCLKLTQHGQTTNRALAENLMTADLKRVHRILQDTTADPITAPEAARMAESIRAVFNTNAEALMCLPEDGEIFSIREWVRREKKEGSLLFVSARHVDLPLYKALLTLWLDLSVNTLMTLPRTRSLRTWYLFDELGALHRLPAIENGLQTARGFGGAIVLGLHSIARLQAVYGREGAENLTSLARTKLILATADRKTAETCAEFIGNREVRQMDEAYSYGYNNLRDASTLTPKKEIAPLVIPDDVTNLPALHGFVKFPDGFPAARVVLQFKDYPQVALGFEPRTDATLSGKPARAASKLAKVLLGGEDDDEGEGEGEAGGREAQDKASYKAGKLPGDQLEDSSNAAGEDARQAAARRTSAVAAALELVNDVKPGEPGPDMKPAGDEGVEAVLIASQNEATREVSRQGVAADQQPEAGKTPGAKPGLAVHGAQSQRDPRFEATAKDLATAYGVDGHHIEDDGMEIE
jgi:type IV conjugative transfer system coupling protein TraD|tara:strand:- start:3320 stop:5740 length:2421 start_codon:yes stop_codon:yes gene_type:complete